MLRRMKKLLCYLLMLAMLMTVVEPIPVKAATSTMEYLGGTLTYDSSTQTMTVSGNFKGAPMLGKAQAGYVSYSLFYGIFNNAPIRKIVVKDVTFTTDYAANRMFARMPELEEVVFENCKGGKKLTSMDCMFANCAQLKKVDLSGLDTSENVLVYDSMFRNCVSLNELNMGGVFGKGLYIISEATYEDMFKDCKPYTIWAPQLCEPIIKLNGTYKLEDGSLRDAIGGKAVRTKMVLQGGGDNPGPSGDPYVRVEGDTAVGEALTAIVYNPESLGKISYQWKRNGENIPGANSSTYIISASDYQCMLMVEVRGENGQTFAFALPTFVRASNVRKAPTGLKGIAPTYKDGMDGQITGTDYSMEWSTNESFTNAKKCSGNVINGLKPGTYYIRYYATTTEPASLATVVDVPNSTAEDKLTGKVTINGTARVGSTLKAELTEVNGRHPIYTWKMTKGNKTSTVASGESFTITISQLGAVVWVEVTDEYLMGSIASAKTAEIIKAYNDKAPANLKAKAASVKGAADGKITNTTSAMEYSTNKNFSNAKTCGDNQTTGLKAGTYYVRYKETSTTLAGPSVEVVVPDGKEIIPDSTVVTDKFVDVNTGDWFVASVQFVFDNSIMQGVSDIEFQPLRQITRAEFAQVLYNMEGKPKVKFKNSFLDVSNGDWYASSVTWAVENGIASGYPKKNNESKPRFGATDTITREQMAQMLYKYSVMKKYKTSFTKGVVNNFKDHGKISDWALEAMNWAVSNKVINGTGAGEPQLMPNGKATRAECAAMIKNLFENVKDKK